MPNIEEIKNLRRHLREQEKLFQNRDALLAKREEVEHALYNFKLETEEASYLLHQNPHDTDLKKSHEQQQRILEQLRMRKMEMDHYLDEIEELTQEKINSEKTRLIKMMLELQPQHTEHLLQLESLLKSREHLKLNLETFNQATSKVDASLGTALNIRQSLRGWGIFRYIIGRNPSVGITEQMKAAYENAKEGLAMIAAITMNGENERLRDLYANIAKNLRDIQEICSKRWGFKSMDTEVKYEHERLQDNLNALNFSLNETNHDLAKLEEELNHWIDKFE